MAEAEYQQAADIDPLALPAWEGLASAQMTEGRYAEGVEAYGRLVSRPQGHLSSSPEQRLHLGSLYLAVLGVSLRGCQIGLSWAAVLSAGLPLIRLGWMPCRMPLEEVAWGFPSCALNQTASWTHIEGELHGWGMNMTMRPCAPVFQTLMPICHHPSLALFERPV